MNTPLNQIQFKLKASPRLETPPTLYRGPRESSEALQLRAEKLACAKYWDVTRKEPASPGVEVWHCEERLIGVLADGFRNIHEVWDVLKLRLGLSTDEEFVEEFVRPWLMNVVGHGRRPCTKVMESEEWTVRLCDIVNNGLLLGIKLDYFRERPASMPAIIWNSHGEDDKTFQDRVKAYLFSKGWYATYPFANWGDAGVNNMGFWTVSPIDDGTCG